MFYYFIIPDFINILLFVHMSHQLLFDEGNTLDELARSSKRASRFPEKCGRLPTPAYKKRCLAKDGRGGQDQSKLRKWESDSCII